MIYWIFPLLVWTVSAAILPKLRALAGSQVCSQIAANVSSSSEVFYPLSTSSNFRSDIKHYMSSSSQTPMCVVEVGSPSDVSTVIKLLGSTRTPFAVKSGGHASNPGFSSTPGVFISLVRMKQVNLSQDKSTVTIGMGNVWTEVYKALDNTGVNVVGGRVVGPGTGGFTLGGGYSWKTNQYGLTCDTVVSYNLVLPNGTITTVDSRNGDLFFALKGGLNRFGIVTSIVYKTVPQPPKVYAGVQAFAPSAIPALINATESFHNNNKDPKAAVILTINGGPIPGALLISFYDGPNRPQAFDPYKNIPSIVNRLKSQSFASFSTSVPANVLAGNRGAFGTLSTSSLTKGFMEAVRNESRFYGRLAKLRTGVLLSYDIEPFLPYGKFATDSAYPHENSQLPLFLFYSWVLAAEDSYWRGIMQQSLNHLTEVAKKEGIYKEETSYQYPNYALSTASGAQMYGTTNAARLKKIQARYDPDSVMSLTGGFSF